MAFLFLIIDILVVDRLVFERDIHDMPLERKAPGVIYRQPVNQPLQTGLKAVGSIGNHAMILNTGSIKNVRIGDYCHICGTCRISNGSVNSNMTAPVPVSYTHLIRHLQILKENRLLCKHILTM